VKKEMARREAGGGEVRERRKRGRNAEVKGFAGDR
jgi:hypothetical protein